MGSIDIKFNQFCHIEEDPVKGRCVVVSNCHEIATGTCFLEENPYALSILSKYKDTFCTVCLCEADPDIRCDDCSQVSYCSEECQENHRKFHELECEALEDIDYIEKKSDTDRDLLRLLIRILCQKYINNNEEMFEKVLNMTYTITYQEPTWIDSVKNGIDLIYQVLSPELHLSQEQTLALACRINENAHSLHNPLDVDHWIAVGMFPKASLINHSCRPNSIWSNTSGGKLYVKTICNLHPGEEICVSYINIHIPKEERKKTLLKTKHFHCECDRCLGSESDILLNGICCCKCGGLINTIKDIFKCATCDRTWKENQINSLETVMKEIMVRIQKDPNENDFEKIARFIYDEKNNQRTNSDLKLHPCHAIVTKCYHIMADWFQSKLKYKEAVEAYRYLALRYLQLHGENTLLLAYVSYEFVYAVHRLLAAESIPIMKYLTEAEEKLKQCQQIWEICLPNNHPSLQKCDVLWKHLKTHRGCKTSPQK